MQFVIEVEPAKIKLIKVIATDELREFVHLMQVMDALAILLVLNRMQVLLGPGGHRANASEYSRLFYIQ